VFLDDVDGIPSLSVSVDDGDDMPFLNASGWSSSCVTESVMSSSCVTESVLGSGGDSVSSLVNSASSRATVCELGSEGAPGSWTRWGRTVVWDGMWNRWLPE